MTDFEKMGFKVEEAKNALAGDYEGLYCMCNWWYTPQGINYWENAWYQLRHRKPLSEEARSIIEGWISEYGGESKPEEEPDNHEGMIYNSYSNTWSFF